MNVFFDSYKIRPLTFARIVDGSGDEACGARPSCDSFDSVYIGGTYSFFPATIKNQSGAVLATLPAPTNYAAYVSKFDMNGTYSHSLVIDANGNDVSFGTACDSTSNVYFCGYYEGISPLVRFVNSSNVTSNVGTLPAPTSQAVFLCKFNSSGMYQYSRVVDGTGLEFGNDVATDAADNVYIAGSYNGAGPTVRAVTSSNVVTNVGTLPSPLGDYTSFVSKFDSNGTYQYSRVVDGTVFDAGRSVACDSSNNMYFCGEYNGTPNIRTVTSAGVTTNVGTLPAASLTAGFACKFNSTGVYQYSIVIDATNGEDTIQSVHCDSTGSVYIAGYYTLGSVAPFIKFVNSASVSTNVGILPIATTSTRAFVSKFNSTGTYQYSRVIDFYDNLSTVTLTTNISDDMYMCCGYNGTPTLYAVTSSNVTSTIRTLPASLGSTAALVSKFDSAGTYQYSRIVDNTNAIGSSDIGYGVTCDSFQRNVYMCGKYYQDAPFIKDENDNTLGTLPAGTSDVGYLVKFNLDGNFS